MLRLSEVPLTAFRYGLGGWADFLGNLVLHLSPGQEVTIRLKDFTRLQEEEAVTSLRNFLSLLGEAELQSKWEGRHRLAMVDTYLDLQDPRDRPDLLIILRAV